jgi:ABC-2 type transport system ATP-binding protein
MTEFAIQTEGLSRRFANNIAVNELTLTVAHGEVFGLLGHNGAGKTTTVRLLNGVLDPSVGTARVLGLDPVAQGPQLRQRTGVLTETPALDDRLNANDTLSIWAEIYGVAPGEIKQRVEQVLGQFGLSERAQERVGGYSKGMRQRLALARTILHDPELLFLDEPTAGLDPVATREVHQLIKHFSQTEQRTIILCTHNLIEAQRLCHRVAILAQGRLLAAGTPSELSARLGHRQRLLLTVALEQLDRAGQLIRIDWPASEVNVVEGEEPPGTLLLQGFAHAEIPALVAGLANAGISIYRLTPEEATLEDVYFALNQS